jgi:hypothetical protein
MTERDGKNPPAAFAIGSIIDEGSGITLLA